MRDLGIVWRMVRGAGRSRDASARMDTLYRTQAADYDRFRERLLHGRRELVERLAPPPGARVVELGGGTGANVEHFGDRLATLGHVTIVDLCPPLLDVARARIDRLDWTNVDAVHADATRWRPDEPADCVYLSYSLTMIPDWHRAIDNAVAMLRPGGVLGVVDYYVSRKHPDGIGRVRHGALARAFWRGWFGRADVFVNPDHLPYLADRVDPRFVDERRGSIPYVPLLRSPYFLFVGEKRRSAE